MTPTYSKNRGFWEFPKSGQILTYKSAPQGIASKGKNLEAPECPTMGIVKQITTRYLQYLGRKTVMVWGTVPVKSRGAEEAGNDVVYTAGVPRGGNVSNCRHCCGNWVGFPAFCTFLSFSITEVKIRQGVRVAQGVVHQWDSVHGSSQELSSGRRVGAATGTIAAATGQRQGPGWPEAGLWGKGRYTHLPFPLLGGLALLLPPAGAHWRQQHPGHLVRRPLAASRSFLCRRDSGAGNESSQTGCQEGWEEGRGSHMG